MFNSEELSSSIESLSSKAQNVTQRLDRISDDIKALEKWFQEHNICFEACVPLQGQQVLTKSEKETVQKSGICVDVFAEEFLMWKREEKSGKFRIMYQRLLVTEDIPGYVPPNFNGVVIDRPLIECPADIRFQSESKLPELVKAVEATLN